ncbi:Facilitated trehalose transporter Tret1 [Chamberlinius hualienensis]
MDVIDEVGHYAVAVHSPNSKPELLKHYKSLLATLSAALGACALGSVMTYSSPAIPDLQAGPSPFDISDTQIAIVVSIASLGGLIGGPTGGIMLDRFGRQFTLVLATMPFVFGWLLVIVSPNVYCMCAGRLLTGFGAAIMDVAVPVYISEIAAPSVRGFLGSCHELSTNIGVLYVFAFGTFLSWIWLAVACEVIPCIMLLCMVLMPESPRWLLKMGRKDECEESLKWIRGKDYDISGEKRDIASSIAVASQNSNSAKWSEFLKPNVRRPVIVIIGLMFFQQMSGYGAIPQYMVSILEASGNPWDPNSETAVVGAVGVVANLISALIVDRVGRRVMLLVSATLMTLSLAGTAIYFTLIEKVGDGFIYDEDTIISDYSMVVFACILLYNMSVALGYGPIPFYLASELFPLRVRGKAGGLAIFSLWLFTFITSFTFPYAVQAMGEHGVFWMMTGFGFFSIVFAYFMVPETKGMSLEEIEKKIL